MVKFGFEVDKEGNIIKIWEIENSLSVYTVRKCQEHVELLKFKINLDSSSFEFNGFVAFNFGFD
jgi:hypothetical protein